MIKQILTAVIATLSLSLSAASVFAIETEVDCVADPTNEACIVTTSDEYGTMPISETPTSYNDTPVRDNCYPEEDDCDPTDTEVIVDETEIEEAAEPELWPMYLSFGALGLALLVIIILNLFGGRKHRK